ncbi:uncharacterized protein [Oncorhynchus clarkii lewisi]|uniref:uncharacterized protein n=1 Tax=Oncorhynchus clarkii lewisi TaxID=490388 RepID=UPI0039B81F7D
MYKTKARPYQKDVSLLLDLEFQARRAFIDSDATKEQDRPTKILQAYPCFRELDHVMDELRRNLDRGNSRFVPELKTLWGTFYNKTQFYGVLKKVMKPPLLDKVKHSIALMRLYQTCSHHLRLQRRSYILESAEDPNTFLQARPLFSPVVIVCKTNCNLGTMPVVTFPKENIYASIDARQYLMACYYAFHLTYPKCIATLLSVL